MKNFRLRLLALLAGCWICLIAFRLYDLQVSRYDNFHQAAKKQQQQVVDLYPPRGTIFDAQGRELAVSVEVSSVAADPSKVDDPAATAAALGEVLEVDVDNLTASLSSNRAFVWVDRKLDQPLADAVRALDLEGVFFLRESKRYYPLRELAAPVLGYVGVDNSGLAGLEYVYDGVVASEPGKRRVVRDARFGTVLYPDLKIADAMPGQDLHLTLDAAIQNLVERELAAAVASSGARSGMILVMNPHTGAILAMASYPTFDPNHFAASPKSHWRNQPVEDAFEPGSTFKMVTLAAALEAGKVDPLETIDCEMGSIYFNRTRIKDHHPFGMLTAREIIAKSSNVGAIKLGAAAGRQRLYDAIQRFGFGRPTGIDLPSESAGIVRSLERWSELSPAYISFGQSISVTTLQLTNAFAAIANGGRLLRPYIVESIGSGDERLPQERKIAGLTIAPSSVLLVRSMLESVVLEGTAKAAAMPGYRAAGKTGTAQKAIPGRGYADGRYIASFVGFAPVKNPALAAAVILDEPWPRYHGGEVAAPVFKAIASQILLSMGIAPERDSDDPWPVPPRTEKPPSNSQLASLGNKSLATVPSGTVPDFAGLSARQAVALSTDIGLRLALNGHGAVGRQLPSPGTPLEEASGTVEIWLENAGGM